MPREGPIKTVQKGVDDIKPPCTSVAGLGPHLTFWGVLSVAQILCLHSYFLIHQLEAEAIDSPL